MTTLQITLLFIQITIFAYLIIWNRSLAIRLELVESRVKCQKKLADGGEKKFINALWKREKEKWFKEMESKGWKIIYYTCPVTERTEKIAVEKDGVEVEYSNQLV